MQFGTELCRIPTSRNDAAAKRLLTPGVVYASLFLLLNVFYILRSGTQVENSSNKRANLASKSQNLVLLTIEAEIVLQIKSSILNSSVINKV